MLLCRKGQQTRGFRWCCQMLAQASALMTGQAEMIGCRGARWYAGGGNAAAAAERGSTKPPGMLSKHVSTRRPKRANRKTDDVTRQLHR